MAEMTETVGPARTRAPRGRGSRRSNGGRGGGGRGKAGEPTVPSDEEPVEAREIILSPPIPKSMIGTTAVGKISDVVKKGRAHYGFIVIGEGTRDLTPRIYFNFKEYTETKFPPRRGHIVEFMCAEDSSERAYAENVRLTKEGSVAAAEKDLKYQAGIKKVSGEVKERRVRREVKEGRSIKLTVSCEGKDETQMVDADVTQSIGKTINLSFNSLFTC